MAKSKITGKTFDEMLSESTELDISSKFKNGIYEDSRSVHSMGMIIHLYAEDGGIFLFKDAGLTEPVTDNELLAMYLDEVKPVYLAGDNSLLKSFSKFQPSNEIGRNTLYLEYKDENIEKRFFKVNNMYYSGETYEDLFGSVPGKDKSTKLETLWEGTFTGESGYGGYIYTTTDLQGIDLITKISEVRVTYDGKEYTSFVSHEDSYHMSGNMNLSKREYPYQISYTASGNISIKFTVESEGAHSLKIEAFVHSDE